MYWLEKVDSLYILWPKKFMGILKKLLQKLPYIED